MPEYPDITVYIEALEQRILGQVLERVRVVDLFVLRTAVPPVTTLEKRRVDALSRIGKRVAIGFEGDTWLVIHMMIAGRLHWAPGAAKPSARNALAHFTFSTGTLTLAEAGTKHRASLHVVPGETALRALDPGGIEVFSCSPPEFAAALTRESHTLKRALTDPHLFSGIGNAYSDEILHAAKLPPTALSQKLSPEETSRLLEATRTILRLWTERLRAEAGADFPENVTAFRSDMAVHGKFGQPCPVCGAPVQRIRYVENEVNYCPRCQTGGRILADRSLSRLLKSDWPRTIEEWEQSPLRR